MLRPYLCNRGSPLYARDTSHKDPADARLMPDPARFRDPDEGERGQCAVPRGYRDDAARRSP
ncbi:hypothetical protein GCM10010390_48140 [Streptomyces mordarskii]|uniref:Uncharacterized protein n=1 Tax=Streptomyces mordarskii TaxID=1226758 RepID=A0ABN1DDF0_9ACTN